MNWTKNILLICLLASGQMLWGQDMVFSQFYAAPTQLNPALTGLVEAPYLNLNYRNQWPNIPNAYSTYALSASKYFSKYNSGVGVSLLGDVAGNGIYRSVHVGLSYAYDIRFSDNFFIRTGIEASFINKYLSWNKLVFLDQIDVEQGIWNASGVMNPTAEAQGINSRNYFDMGFGLLINTPYVHAGFSMKHLNTPEEGFLNQDNSDADNLPMRYTFHLGGEIPLNKYNKVKKTAFLSPNVLFIKQRMFYQLNVGSNIKYNNLLGGLYFRHTFNNADALIFMLGFQKGVFRLGYSYDLTVSKLESNSGGAHEVSIILNFENNQRKRRPNYNDCLEIFR